MSKITDENKNKSTATEILGDIDDKGKIQGSLLNDIIKFINRIIDEANSRNQRIYKLMNKQDLKLVKLKEISSIEDLLGMALSEKEMDILEKTYENKKLTQEEINEKVDDIVSTIENLIAIHKDRLYVSGSEFDPNMIWISDILNPYYFPASIFSTFPPSARSLSVRKFRHQYKKKFRKFNISRTSP